MPQINLFLPFLKGAVPSQGALGAQSELYVGSLHGLLYEPGYNKNLFLAANSAAVTTSAALATTYVGLCVSNPASSGKNLSLVNVSAAFLVAPSTITTLFLAVGYAAGGITVHTTPLTPQSTFIGTGPTPAALADSACTLVGTPAYAVVLGETPTATTSLSVNRDFQGSIIIPPGAYACIATNIASPASGFVGSMIWEEQVP